LNSTTKDIGSLMTQLGILRDPPPRLHFFYHGGTECTEKHGAAQSESLFANHQTI